VNSASTGNLSKNMADAFFVMHQRNLMVNDRLERLPVWKWENIDDH